MKNYRYSTNHRNDCKAWEESGAKAAVGATSTIAGGWGLKIRVARDNSKGYTRSVSDAPGHF
ncbi:hypothetical protein GCM10010270_32150 [Streptomyces violaceus]|nr:hypothetical protein GCM10010270_32150 [Streptomyces janthinus]